jgi:hypothetical protein
VPIAPKASAKLNAASGRVIASSRASGPGLSMKTATSPSISTVAYCASAGYLPNNVVKITNNAIAAQQACPIAEKIARSAGWGAAGGEVTPSLTVYPP